ncbi:MAG TPA: NAD(P)-binding domain-containing protein, partial [Acidimicrobiales bacterium]|nr:NAD(P)-binding domain-containing protein [Acidimicrobiales bacterium]
MREDGMVSIGEVGPKKLVVVGQGYVGLPLAVRAASVGFDVIGFDVNEARAKTLADGTSFIEDVSTELLRQVVASGNYHATCDESLCDGFDIALITVPTPLKDGNPDLSHIESAAEMLSRHLSAGSLVVLESTTYPGTTTEVLAPILEEGSGLTAGADFYLGYSPERIDPGNKTWTL